MQPKVLIIDRNTADAEGVQRLLTAHGYQVEISGSAVGGLSKAGAGDVDAIILEAMLKTPSEGIAVAQKLKKDKRTAKIPLVMLTGIRQVYNLPFGLEADQEYLPVDALIEKPMDQQVLLDTMRSFIKS